MREKGPDAGSGPTARLWAEVFVPLAALTVYLAAQERFLAWLLPEYAANVSAVFVAAAWKLTLAAAAGVGVVCFVLVRFRGRRRPEFLRPWVRPSVGDAVLTLLPLTPVMQYVVNNQDILSRADSLRVLVVFAALAALYVVVLPALLGRFGSRRGLVIAGVAFTFTLTQMASLSAQMNWLERGNLAVQSAVLGGVALACLALFRLTGARFTRLVVVAYFLVNAGSQFVGPREREITPGGSGAEGLLAELVGDRAPAATPSIMFLVYDAYVTNETMLGYGLDNSAQEEHLASLGFTLYPHTYSVARSSIGSVSRVLTASLDFGGNSRRGVSGGGAVNSLLASWGYENHGVFYSDYFFQGIGSSYDLAYPSPQRSRPVHDLITRAILMGEFRFDIEFDAPSREEFELAKATSFAPGAGRPRFVYVHERYPGHSQNSGKCLPEEIELFAERLDRANRLMKQDLAQIMTADPGAIVIVAGDHGPHLTKNCHATDDAYDLAEIDRLDLQDRYGTFLAIRWPAADHAAYDDITVLQDLFPALFAYLLEDERLLEAKLDPGTTWPEAVSGARVEDGVIRGGRNDGEPLFTR